MTENQKKQLKFLEDMEYREVMREARGFCSLSNLTNYEVKCRTCGDAIVCHTEDTAKMFIYEHEDHKTWVTYMGKTRH